MLLCSGCPILEQCKDYGRADGRGTGMVWGGKYYEEENYDNP